MPDKDFEKENEALWKLLDLGVQSAEVVRRLSAQGSNAVESASGTGNPDLDNFVASISKLLECIDEAANTWLDFVKQVGAYPERPDMPSDAIPPDQQI